MSVTFIKPYVVSKLSGLGYTEWSDAFGEDNLPSTLIDKSFHYRVVSLDGRGINQETIEFNLLFEIKLYFKGFNDPGSALDLSLADSQTIISELLNIADLDTAQIKGLFFDSMTLDPLDDALNDNIIVASIRFNAKVFSCISI